MNQGDLDQSEVRRTSLDQSDASLAGGSLEDSSFQNISRIPEQYLVTRQSISSGPLEFDAQDDSNIQDGVLDESQSPANGVLDKYLLSESSQSIENFLTPSLGSVQSGLLVVDSVPHSNRSSLVLSEDDMKSVSSTAGLLDMDNMMVEVGNLDSSTISHTEFQTVLSNRDAVIQKLSSNLHKLMKERTEDGLMSRKMEEEVKLLQEQVSLAIQKAAANKEFKDKYKSLVVENENLKRNYDTVTAQLNAKDSKMLKLVKDLGQREEEISTFESSKSVLLEKIKRIQEEVENNAKSKSFNDSECYKRKIEDIEAAHMKEIEEMKEAHEAELQEAIDKHDEEQVVELNLLDYELVKLRDEKQDLIDELKAVKCENEILKNTADAGSEEVDTEKLHKVVKDYEQIKEKLQSLESLYSEEVSRRQSLLLDIEKERNLRENLEYDLANIGSVLDDTQYQFLPLNVRQSLERSVRLSIECGALDPSRRESSSLIQLFDRSSSVGSSQLNRTQSNSEYDINDMDATPTHKPSDAMDIMKAEHEETVDNLKAEHEREMSELRKYFENVCQELEMKYRAETEEAIPCRSTAGVWSIAGPVSLDTNVDNNPAPISLELGATNVEFEFESMSPRSGFSSDNQQLSFSSQVYHHSRDNSRDTSRHHHSRNNSGLVSDSEQPSNNGRLQLEDEIVNLNKKVSELEKQIEIVTANHRKELQHLKDEHVQEIEDLKEASLKEIDVAKEAVRKELESEHVVKFSQVSKQIQTLQQTELDNLKISLTDRHLRNIQELKEKHEQEIAKLKQSMLDVQESQKLELGELQQDMTNDVAKDKIEMQEFDSKAHEAMRADMDKLEEEKYNLRSMQILMKDLMKDLARHYDLSERQVKFLSDSTFFDSFSLSLGGSRSNINTPVNTPFKYFQKQETNKEPHSESPVISLSEISQDISQLRLDNSSASHRTVQDIMERVKTSNCNLEDLQTKFESLISSSVKFDGNELVDKTVNAEAELRSSEFVGLEAGRLEVEKARLEAELSQALQRIDELEAVSVNRLSLVSRSDVLSGTGETGGEPTHSLGLEAGEEVRDRAARLLSQYREDDSVECVSVEDAVTVLADLLVFSDNISARVRDRVEEVQQQLEVADKQLRATRAFLEDQAAEREVEREEWDRRLATLTQTQSSSKSVSRGSSLEDAGEDSKDEADNVAADGQTRVAHLESELAIAVDKIYELREIIRGLETKLETRSVTELQQAEVVRNLKVALEEAILSQELVSQELELVRSATGDQEIQEHIRSLEEQLKTKSAELSKQKASSNNIQNIAAQLRGLEERVEQSTRELEHSVLKTTSDSASSSRVSTPAPSCVGQMLGSCEDIGTISGMELEELNRLEKKIKHLEKAETAAVEKVKLLEVEKTELKTSSENLQSQMSILQDKMESTVSELKVYMDKVQELNVSELSLKKLIKRLETEKEALEDIESERDILQAQLTQQQMTISSLQSSLQSSRHKPVASIREDMVNKMIEEKESLRAELESMKTSCKRLEQDKVTAQSKLAEVRQRLLDMEPSTSNDNDKVCGTCDKLLKDNEELRTVNVSMQGQLSQARAAQLAAQKTEMPLLSQKLLDEKNLEIEQLRQHLSSLSCVGIKHSTPHTVPSGPIKPQSWLTSLDDTTGSVENLRDATVMMRDRLPDLSHDQLMRNSHSSKLLQGSAQKLQTIQETVIQDSFAELSGNKTHLPRDISKQDNMTQEGVESAKPNTDLTEADDDDERNLQDLEEALNRKVSEVEFMTKLLSEKDEMIEHLQDNIEDIQAQLEDLKKADEANKEILQKAREDEDKLIEVNNKLLEAKNKLQEIEDKSFEHADQSLLEELRVLREENQDRIQGMENLHGIIENSQKQLDLKNEQLSNLQQQLDDVSHKAAKADEYMMAVENLKQSIGEKDARFTELEEKLKEAALRTVDNGTMLEEKLSKVVQEKQVLESELERVTLEMASVQNVVSEMTQSFKQQILLKDNEVKKHQQEKQILTQLNSQLTDKFKELEKADSSNREKIGHLERRVTVAELKQDAANDNLESGSLDDLSNLVQAELDLSSELDNTLMSQVVTGLGLDTSGVNSTGVSEIQRLIRKIQADGIKVLSLSERLFLMQHANVGRNMTSSDKETGSKERELERKLELLEFQLKQEKFLSEDLRKSLSHEKRSALDNLTKVSDERRSRSQLETRINHLEQELEIAQDKLGQAEYKLSLRESQLHFNSDSENEEFLNTIEAQKLQIMTLEDSLRMERENFSQLQHVLEVERGRGKRDHDNRTQGDVTQQRFSLLHEELEKERCFRKSLESGIKTGDVSKMIIGQLHRDLKHERDKHLQHEAMLAKEKQRYKDLHVEYEHMRNSQQLTSSEANYKTAPITSHQDIKYLKDKNLELERYNCEIELRIDNAERESRRLRADIVSLEADLKEERAKNVAGMSKDQLSRMQQVNKFLEHNLKENGEMLASLAKLYEEGRVMKQRNSELEDQLIGCVCGQVSAVTSAGSTDHRAMMAKYLRADSYRKALVWQKRYLLVLLTSSESSETIVGVEPVFPVTRDYTLTSGAKWRAAVHTVIAVIRMRFLVKRWRTGKRAGAYTSSQGLTPNSPRALSEVPMTGRSSAGIPSLSSCQSPVASPATMRSVKSMSVPSYPRVNSPTTSSSASQQVSPRQPPTISRSQSFKSPLPRRGAGTNAPFTGHTPPTRDVKVRRCASVVTPARDARRSLETKMTANTASSQPSRRTASLTNQNTTLAAVGDENLQKDLEEYFQRFGSIQKGRGAKH